MDIDGPDAVQARGAWHAATAEVVLAVVWFGGVAGATLRGLAHRIPRWVVVPLYQFAALVRRTTVSPGFNA